MSNLEKEGQNNLHKIDYYDCLSKKIKDFFLGLISYLLVFIILPIIFYSTIGDVSDIGNIPPLVMLLITIYLIYYFFKIHRRFIAIGVIVAITIPMLAFGACMMIIISMY